MFKKNLTKETELNTIKNLFKYLKFLLYAIEQKYPIFDENDLNDKLILKETINDWILELQNITQSLLNQSLTPIEANNAITLLLEKLETLTTENEVLNSIINVYNYSIGPTANSGLPTLSTVNMGYSIEKCFKNIKRAFKE